MHAPAKLGVLYTSEGMRRFAEVIGLGRATAMFLLGEPVPASRALEIGLVHRVVPASALEAEARAIGEALVANAPLSVRGAKAILARCRWDARPGPEVLEEVYARIATCLNSPDAREGKRAFAEKRRPAFRGE